MITFVGQFKFVDHANRDGSLATCFLRGTAQSTLVPDASRRHSVSRRTGLLIFDVELIHHLFDVGDSGDELFDFRAARL